MSWLAVLAGSGLVCLAYAAGVWISDHLRRRQMARFLDAYPMFRVTTERPTVRVGSMLAPLAPRAPDPERENG